MKSLTILLFCGLLTLSCGQNKEAEAQPADVAPNTTEAAPEADAAAPDAETETEAKAPATNNATNIKNDIDAMATAIMLAYADKDAEALADFFTDDAEAYQPNASIVTGRENIRDFWQAMIDVGADRFDMTIKEAVGMGSVGHAKGVSSLYIEEDQLIEETKFVVLLKKVSGHWKIQTDVWNSNMPCVSLEN